VDWPNVLYAIGSLLFLIGTLLKLF